MNWNRLLSEIVRIHFRRKLTRGIEISIIPSYACNYRCSYCGRHQFGDPAPQRLRPLKEWQDFIERFDRSLQIDRLRIKTIIVNGGEPTLLPYFVDLCNWILDKGYMMIIQTNLSNIEVLKKVRQSTRLKIHATHHAEYANPDVIVKRWREIDRIHRTELVEFGERTLKGHKRTQLKQIIYFEENDPIGNMNIDPNLHIFFSCGDHVKANI